MQRLHLSHFLFIFFSQGRAKPFNLPIRLFILGKFSSIEMDAIFIINVHEED